MFAKRRETAAEIEHHKALVAPFKNLDWAELAAPNSEVRLLQSFKDKVRDGVPEVSKELKDAVSPLLKKLGIRVDFEPEYHLSPDCEYGSKFDPADFGPPRGFSYYMDREDYLKLTNIHF